MWCPIFEAKRDHELAALYDPYSGPFNHFGRHSFWASKDVDDVLAEQGYIPHSAFQAKSILATTLLWQYRLPASGGDDQPNA
jgi:hypothetical protein